MRVDAVAMKKTRIALIVAGALALSGCQTMSTVDTFNANVPANNQSAIAERKTSSAKQQFAAGNYGLAQRDFLEAVEATPKNGMAWLGLAASYDQLGRFDLAEKSYQELIRLEGRKPAILNNYGYSYLLRGEIGKARSLLNEARALSPVNSRIEANWNLAYAS